MYTHLVFALCLAFASATGPSVRAVSPTPDELIESERVVAAWFRGTLDAEPLSPGLTVLANNDAPQKDGRAGTPLRLRDATFQHGIFCHAPSKIVVRLPAPGRTFRAVAGVDSNEQTSGGRGSIVFAVSVAEGEGFRSDVQREGMPPLPVTVELGGATEFVLEVGDGGDGIACDQADWADAAVELEDGRVLRISELPMALRHRGPIGNIPPFSFTIAGKPAAEILDGCAPERSARRLDDARTAHSITWNAPGSSLEVRCDAVEYHDFPAVEWTLYLKNIGSSETPLIEDVRALDIQLRRGGLGGFLLHHAVGSPANGNDYGPLETPLGPGATKRVSAAGGRPTNSDLCFFNLEGAREGMILAVGWPGQWAAEFARDAADGITVRIGQELTRFRLVPGEEVRSPLIALLWWQGDRARSQNLWRRWMLAHVLPRPGGQLPPPQFLASSSRAYEEMRDANEENQILHIDRYLEEGLPLDCWWMDAGWYVNRTGWPNVGTWEVDPRRFPRTLRPISDHAHAKGVKTLLWFEPERVTAGTWLAETHPEWILGGAAGGLLNLGNPDALNWLTEHIDRILTDNGIDIYRQDFNMDPLQLWRANDAPDRQGITEIQHVTGLLAYWDELRRRHPDMLFDTCASGGRRNDLETLRRAVPLWRSDYAFEPVGHQCMTYGISAWIPFHGTGTVASAAAPYYGGGFTRVEPYAFWSNAAPSLVSGIDIRIREIDYASLRRLLAQWRRIAPDYYGDYWPLTAWTRAQDAWIAWQFDRPEAGTGVVQAFRRGNSIFLAARIPLRGLDPAADYEVTRLDAAEESWQVSGAKLLDEGLEVSIPDRPGAAILAYRRLPAPQRAGPTANPGTGRAEGR